MSSMCPDEKEVEKIRLKNLLKSRIVDGGEKEFVGLSTKLRGKYDEKLVALIREVKVGLRQKDTF